MARSRNKEAAPDFLEKIKRLVVVAMFSDDELMHRFVLKGGNALDLVMKVSARASVDIDLSMEDDFSAEELAGIQGRLELNLQNTFRPAGFEAFDVTLDERPETMTPDLQGFWGGYLVTFKLIDSMRFAELAGDLDAQRRSALRIGAKGKFEIDISRFEFCGGKVAHQLEGYRIFTYSPEMLVGEKLRAICQQMPAYGSVVKRNRAGSARARDFLDIFVLIDHFNLDMTSFANRNLIAQIFAAKHVPLELMDHITEYRDFHRSDFLAVQASQKPGARMQGFDFYFDFVEVLCGRLKALRNV